jgi:hypothetical protein
MEGETELERFDYRLGFLKFHAFAIVRRKPRKALPNIFDVFFGKTGPGFRLLVVSRKD